MVVPSCLRSTSSNHSISLIRLAAACRNVSNSTRSRSQSLISRRNLSGLSNSLLNLELSGSNINNNNVDSKVITSMYSTVLATSTNNLSVAQGVEDEGIVEVLSGEGNKNFSSSNSHHAEAADRAWSNLESIKSERTPNPSEYLETLRQLSVARDFTRSLAIFKEMKNSEIALNAEIFSLILNSVRRTLRAQEIREFFGDSNEFLQRKSQREMDEFSNDKASNFRSNSQNNNSHMQKSIFYDQVSEIIETMKSLKIQPTAWFYEEMANFLTATNQAGVLINLATAMEKRGEIPSIKFYNRMLHCLPRCGLLDRASMLFNRMVLKGTADYYTFLVRASSLVYINQVEAARAVISDLKGKFPLDVVAYNILIKSYLAQGNCEQALQVFNQMTRDPKIAPNRITCRTFLSYFYESSNLNHSESIVSYFEKVNFPETLEDYGNVVKFFARYDPPKVLELFKKMKTKINENSNDKNQIYHAFLRILNDRQVTPDWKKSFANLILDDAESANSNNVSTTNNNPLNCPDLPYHFRMIVDRIQAPDGVSYEIVLKKLIQLRRFDSVKNLYQSMFSPENPHSVSVQPVHRNLNLTALLSTQDSSIKDFINDMHNRRIPISGKNTNLLEEAGIELPRGALIAKKGQGVNATRNNSSYGNNKKEASFSNEHHDINII